MTRFVREVTPLSDHDFFVVLNHYKAKFDYPVHYHPEYEINLVQKTGGKRIIGDSIESFEDGDLVLLGPNTPHAWRGEENGKAHVITIQFHADFLGEKALRRNLMTPISEMLARSRRGILFTGDAVKSIQDRINAFSDYQGFESLINFISLLYDMSILKGQKQLASPSYFGHIDTAKSRRIEKVTSYMQDHLQDNIRIKDIADMVSMSETAFSHFFKKRTRRSFTDFLLDLRTGRASKLLLETEMSISEICYESGFNNISHFNRTFKKKRGNTPSEFRSEQRLITKY
ncbi:AraC family transcriptional regulator [Bacteroidota bacterium]